jgi:hypothetical protein
VYHSANPTESEIVGSAGLALDTSISKDGDPETVKFVDDQWRKSTSVFGKSQDQALSKEYLLSVMGNAKSNVFKSQITDAYQNGNEDIRSAAVNALRFNQDEQSRNLLVQSLNDSSEQVRQTAAASLRYQPFDQKTFDTLKALTSRGAETVGVKIEAYRALVSQMDQPGVKDYLSTREGAESDAQLKAVISGALHGDIEEADGK